MIDSNIGNLHSLYMYVVGCCNPCYSNPRCMKVELRHLHFICPDLNPGNVCPACPKVCNCCNVLYSIVYDTNYNTGYFNRNLELWCFRWMLCLVYLEKRLLVKVYESPYMVTFSLVIRLQWMSLFRRQLLQNRQKHQRYLVYKPII